MEEGSSSMKQYLITENLINRIIDYLAEGKLKDTVAVWMDLKRECSNQPPWEIKKEEPNEPSNKQ